MRVLIINELYQMGGAALQSLRECKILAAHGHEVCYLTMDPEYEEELNIAETHLNIAMKEFERRHFKSLKQLFVIREVQRKTKFVIEKFQPDVIHLNVLNRCAVSVYPLLKKRKCIQTLRDFSVICPKGLGIDSANKVCEGYQCGECMKKCYPTDNLRNQVLFLLSRLHFNRILKLRKKNIDAFIAPGQCLTDHCNKYGIKTECINDPINIPILQSDIPSNFDEKTFLLFGVISASKGVIQLLDAFKELEEIENVKLEIIGRVVPDFQEDFEREIKKHKRVIHYGEMKHDEILAYLNKVYAIVVPSICLENYPNTALEGIAAGRLVLGSDRGGIPEIITNKKCIFDILDKEDIKEKLMYAINMSKEEYRDITKENYEGIVKNNTDDLYYGRLMEQFNRLITKD